MMPVSCHVKWSGVPFVGGPTHAHIRQMNLQLKNPSDNNNNNKNTDFTNTCLDKVHVVRFVGGAIFVSLL